MGSICSCLPLCGENDNTSAAAAADHDSTNSLQAASASASASAARHNAVLDESSVYYDARQSMTLSMMGVYKPATLPDYVPRGSVVMTDPNSLLSVQEPTTTTAKSSSVGQRHRRATLVVKRHLEEPQLKVEQRGYPGNLTRQELEAALDFRNVLKNDEVKRGMVYCFTARDIEDEPYALCRYLRGRNFDTQDTLDMIGESVSNWTDFKKHDFYPTIQDAVGCSGALLLTQYPYLFSGNAKNGCPINYQMIGRIKLEGIACITDIQRIPNYVMHSIIYQFSEQVRTAQAKDTSRVVRCECVAVIDLTGLDTSQLNSTTLGVLKDIGRATGCFPEMLNRMIVLNAGYTFSFFWKLIKAFMDPRTAAKIEIYTNEGKGRDRLLELIDKAELLSDYGGTGPSFDELAQKSGTENGMIRQTSTLMTLGGKSQTVVKLSKTEKATISIYTTSEGEVSLLRDGGSLVNKVEVKRPTGDSSSSSSPFCTMLISDESGPGKLDVAALPSPTANSSDNVLIYVQVFPMP